MLTLLFCSAVLFLVALQRILLPVKGAGRNAEIRGGVGWLLAALFVLGSALATR